MFDWQPTLVQLHCRRCGTPLDVIPEDGEVDLWDCPRCRRAALGTRRAAAVEEDEIIDWLLASGEE